MRLLIWSPAFGGFFLLQQSLHATHGPPHSSGGSILNPVAFVIAGLPAPGSLTELAPQTLCTIIQATANKLLRHSLDLFL